MNEALFLGVIPLTAAVVAAVVGTVLHELGHALAALMAGMYVHLLRFGGGRVVKTIKIGHLPIEIRAWNHREPVGACIAFPVRISGARRSMAISLVGGPLANGLLILAGVAVALRVISHPERPLVDASRFISVFVWTIVQLGAGSTILPFTYRGGTTAHTSDGLKLLRLRRRPQPELDLLVASGLSLQAFRRSARGDVDGMEWNVREALSIAPEMFLAAYLRAVVPIRRGQPAESAYRLRALIERSPGTGLEGHTHADLAAALLLSSPATKADEALEHATIACRLAPGDAAFELVHAAARIQAGEVEEGTRRLRSTTTLLPTTEPWARAIYACVAARALAVAGRLDEARQELHAAAAADPSCPYIESAVSR